MGSELVSDLSPLEKGASHSTLSYIETFYNHLPYYLAIGMSNDDYWNGDCELVKSYRKADEIKKKRDNEKLWLQGMYIYEVLCDVSPIFNPFNRHPKPLPYATEPYVLNEKEQREKEERERKLQQEKIKAKMKAFASAFNKKITGKEVKPNDNR